MIDVQEEVIRLEYKRRMRDAVKHISENTNLSFHYVSVEFNVDVQELQEAYRLSRVRMPQNEGEL